MYDSVSLHRCNIWLLRLGQVKETVLEGLDLAVSAFEQMAEGRHIGTMLVRVSDLDSEV